MRKLVIALIVLLAAPPPPFFPNAAAQPHSPLPEQTMVRLNDGRTVFGHPEWSAGRLVLINRVDGGEVEYRFRPEEIVELRLPEQEEEYLGLLFAGRGDYEEALQHLESLLPERLSLAPILNGAQLRPLLLLAHAYFETGRFMEGITLSDALHPHMRDEHDQNWMERIALLGFHRLGLDDETRERAQTWCRRQRRTGPSALGWWLLAEMALIREDYEEALWISLQPIVFSSALPMEFLNRAYAVAATTMRLTGDENQGFLLYLEMKERNLAWPQSPLFEECGLIFEKRKAAEHLPLPGSEPSLAHGPDAGTPPAKEDLDLPLQAIRKLLPAR